MKKKASTLTDSVPSLVIAIVAVFLLVLLMWKILFPGFNKDEEQAKAYLESLKASLIEADKNGQAEFGFLSGTKDSSVKMVYFGEEHRRGGDNEYFRASGEKNYLCFCYGEKDKARCTACEAMRFPIVFSPEGTVFEADHYPTFSITQQGQTYLFEVTPGRS